MRMRKIKQERKGRKWLSEGCFGLPSGHLSPASFGVHHPERAEVEGTSLIFTLHQSGSICDFTLINMKKFSS
jgi:hypothetical protein